MTPRRGTARPSGWLLACSVVLHVAVAAALLHGAASGFAPGAGERPIDAIFPLAPLETPARPSPAEERAARERQAMLDRVVQPTLAPDAPAATAGAAAAAPEAGRPAPVNAANLPVDAGGSVTRPEIVESSRVLPTYPEAAQRAGLEGVVVLKASIDEHGRVGDVEVMRGLGPLLDDAAVAAVRHWKFRPATRDGKPVKVNYILSVDFRLVSARQGASR